MSAATVFCRNTPVSDRMHKILGGGDTNQLGSRVQFDLPKLKLVAAVSFFVLFVCLALKKQPLTLRNALFTHKTTHVVDTM